MWSSSRRERKVRGTGNLFGLYRLEKGREVFPHLEALKVEGNETGVLIKGISMLGGKCSVVMWKNFL